MHKTLSTLFIGAASVCASFHLSAQEYMFTYSKLYSQMKSNASEGHDDVKIGFFFVNAQNKNLCPINKAWMEKEQHYERLKVSENHELLVPIDSNLRQANPLVFVDTPQELQCDFSMVVMTKQSLQGHVTANEMARILPQMQTLLEDLGGMFASWFTPEVKGLTFEFTEINSGEVVLSDGHSVPITNGKAQVLLTQLQGGYLTLPAETSRVLPYLPDAD